MFSLNGRGILFSLWIGVTVETMSPLVEMGRPEESENGFPSTA